MLRVVRGQSNLQRAIIKYLRFFNILLLTLCLKYCLYKGIFTCSRDHLKKKKKQPSKELLNISELYLAVLFKKVPAFSCVTLDLINRRQFKDFFFFWVKAGNMKFTVNEKQEQKSTKVKPWITMMGS